jgi:hypothetical protein
MTRFAFITAASENYLPGLKAFFNSLVDNSHRDDVILLSFRLPKDFLEWLKTLPFEVRIVEMLGGDQVQETAIERFRVAAELGKDYEAICLVEGDIFLVANNQLWFDLAAKGFIVTGSNGMIVNFEKGYQKQYNIDLGVDNYIYPKVHTTVPIFLPSSDLDWFSTFYNGRMNARSFDDVFGLNILGIKMGKDKRMVCMPPYCFTGIHHFGVKPETGWMDKDGLILSGTEEQVYMIHGKWWDEGWRSDLPRTMELYFKREGMSGKSCQRVYNSIDLGYKLFRKYCDKPLEN